MLLPSKDGVLCDFCKTSYKDIFSYYSINILEFKVNQNSRGIPNNPKLDRDMCCNCYDKLIENVKQFIGPYKPGHIKCDLSKNYKTGTFSYYIANFDKVSVNKSLQPPVDIEKRVMDLNVLDIELLIHKNSANNNKEIWS